MANQHQDPVKLVSVNIYKSGQKKVQQLKKLYRFNLSREVQQLIDKRWQDHKETTKK